MCVKLHVPGLCKRCVLEFVFETIYSSESYTYTHIDHITYIYVYSYDICIYVSSVYTYVTSYICIDVILSMHLLESQDNDCTTYAY